MVSRYYYQYKESRLSTCTLTVHGLLHIARDIRNCGPVWTTWTFYMECFCGFLQRGLQSRQLPWSNLNRWNLHLAYLGQLSAKYNLEDELSVGGQQFNDGPLQTERIYPGCVSFLY
jgi:hypothetical protein